MNFADFAGSRGMKVLAPLGKQEEKLCLVETAEGERRVLRRYPGTAAPCRLLLSEAPISQLPQVYACYDRDGDVISEEEYLEGMCLSELLCRRLLTVSQTAAVIAEVCRALELLHGLGLVHRDLKPENVMLTREGRVVLLDLDAASPLEGAPDTNTTLLGTVGYAAPEQFGFSRCDARADIFALGVMMNVMLTGEHPSVRVAKGRMGRIIQRCIQTNADRRYPSVTALCRQLPKAAALHQCPLCGAVSPGDCLWCGGPARKTSNAYGRAALALSLAALAVSAAALAAAVGFSGSAAGQHGTKGETIQEQLIRDWTAVELLSPTPLELSGQWPAEKSLPYRVPFSYDLDEDGTPETYFFALVEFYPHDGRIDIVQRGTWHLEKWEQYKRFFMPAICREEESGGFVPVPELATLLTEPELRVYFMGEKPETPLSVCLMPEMESGQWQTAMEITCSGENSGSWIMYCQAKLAGEEAEAAMVLTIEKNVSD